MSLRSRPGLQGLPLLVLGEVGRAPGGAEEAQSLKVVPCPCAVGA